IWVIVIYVCVSCLSAFAWQYAVFSELLRANPDARARVLERLPVFGTVRILILYVVTLSAAVALFLLRKAAYCLFCASFAALAFTLFCSTLTFERPTASSFLSIWTTDVVMAAGIWLAMCLYARKLMKEGKLT
ncbi:MAG: hypothetical protein LAP13_07945, partial [Acidobacteriia bacterium]|nr:hypothetical protein [Terriglobia bacterium]